MGIQGNNTGYQAKLLKERHRSWDICDTVAPTPPRRTVIVRMDLPAELVDVIEALAEDNSLSRNSMIVKLLKEASSERR